MSQTDLETGGTETALSSGTTLYRQPRGATGWRLGRCLTTKLRELNTRGTRLLGGPSRGPSFWGEGRTMGGGARSPAPSSGKLRNRRRQKGVGGEALSLRPLPRSSLRTCIPPFRGISSSTGFPSLVTGAISWVYSSSKLCLLLVQDYFQPPFCLSQPLVPEAPASCRLFSYSCPSYS